MRGKLPKKQKKVKRQKFYHSSSEDEDENAARDAPRDFAPVSLESSDEEPTEPVKSQAKFKAQIATKKDALQAPAENDDVEEKDENEASSADDANSAPEDGTLQALDANDPEDSEASEDSDDGSLSETSTNNPTRKLRKRNDPEAFATSISRILNTKLTSQKRSEPILSRSKDAQDANKSLSDQKLTFKAHKQLLAEKKAAQQKGRVKDVLGLNDPSVSTAATTAKEKELRRTAQKGVIKLFNAVRAAQVKGEQAEREAREKGLVGMSKREEKVKEVSKQGFLDMITGAAKQKEGSVEV